MLTMPSADATGAPGGKRVLPAPVLVVIVYVGLLAVLCVAFGIGPAIASGEPAASLLALVGLLPGATALGLWQGNRGARVVAILFFGVLPGLLLLGVPSSARAWFNPDLYPADLDDLDDLDSLDGEATDIADRS